MLEGSVDTPGEAPAACNPNLAARLAQGAQIGGDSYSYS